MKRFNLNMINDICRRFTEDDLTQAARDIRKFNETNAWLMFHAKLEQERAAAQTKLVSAAMLTHTALAEQAGIVKTIDHIYRILDSIEAGPEKKES